MSQDLRVKNIFKIFETADWVPETHVNRISRIVQQVVDSCDLHSNSIDELTLRRITLRAANRLGTTKNSSPVLATFWACANLDVLKKPPILSRALPVVLTFASRNTQKYLLERLLTLTDLPLVSVREIVRFGVQTGQFSGLKVPESLKIVFEDMTGSSILAHLRHFKASENFENSSAPIVNLLHELHQDGGLTKDNIIEQINWARYSSSLIKFWQFHISRESRMQAEVKDEIYEPIFPDASDEIEWCLENSDLAEFGSDAAKRGAVVLQTHSMVRSIVTRVLRKFDLPISKVQQTVALVVHPDDFHITTNEVESVPMATAKLIKLHRRAPRITRIFPDGLISEECRHIEIFGRRIPVSMGAVSIAYFGRAPLYFAQAVWNGEGYVLSMIPGPQISECTSLQEAKSAYLSFYTKCVTEQIMGMPRDLGNGAGVLYHLTKGTSE